MKTKPQCVVYRTGGSLNFKWNRTLPLENPIEGLKEIEKMGYKAFIEDCDRSKIVGLPTTYE